MKTCLFWTIFGDPRYRELLDISRESCRKHTSADLVVFSEVTRPFPPGKAARMAYRFELGAALLDEYDAILHLDADVMVVGDLDSLFGLGGQGLSVAPEVDTNVTGKYWAGPLLNNEERKRYSNIPGFNVGVWLAKRDSAGLLRHIYDNVVNRELSGFSGECVDQHAAIEALLKNGQYNFDLAGKVLHSPPQLLDRAKLIASGIKIVHCHDGVKPNGKAERMRALLA